MDVITTLGRTLGFSLAAGVNLYATVAILGLASRFDWVNLPEQYQAFNNDWLIGAAVAMYLIEFFADKVPYVDTLWDIAHTAIRPVGGALIAVATLGEASPGTQALVALLGGTVAASSHLTKTSTRAAANASPEPFSNWFLSLGEDVFVVGLGYLTMSHPLAALIVGLVLLVVIASFAVAIIRTVRRWFRRVSAYWPGARTVGARRGQGGPAVRGRRYMDQQAGPGEAGPVRWPREAGPAGTTLSPPVSLTSEGPCAPHLVSVCSHPPWRWSARRRLPRIRPRSAPPSVAASTTSRWTCMRPRATASRSPTCSGTISSCSRTESPRP
jgi:hypothetical protein